ncbi:MAG: hypothetical protein J2P18_07280 [Nocardia sp.]|nr:hypothetical protein [Nocardia sp.]
MRLVPEAVLGMAQTIHNSVEVTRGHATRIGDVGFVHSHAGQGYHREGHKIAAGVDGIVAMLNSWSEASGATAGVMRQSVGMTVSTDDQNRDQIARTELGAGGV